MLESKSILASSAMFFIISMLLLAHFGCTEPPVATFVSKLPAIEPEGEFFNLRNAILTNNSSQVGLLFADSFFEEKQNLFLQKYELGAEFITSFEYIFLNYMFELEQSEKNYRYDDRGNFKIGRGHTIFEGTLIGDSKKNEVISETLNKIFRSPNDNSNTNEKVNFYIVWIMEDIEWKILYMEINGTNLKELIIK